MSSPIPHRETDRVPATRALEPMRYTVDSWDPGYGFGVEMEDDLGESTARVEVGVELTANAWRPLDPSPGTARPQVVLFVDGVRRIDARLWVHDVPSSGPATEATEATEATPALAASYAAGVVCCCGSGAHHVTSRTSRGLFTIAAHADDVVTSAGTYTAHRTPPSAPVPPSVALSQALQRRLGELELQVAVAARADLAHHTAAEDDLLVVDGPLRGRTHLPRAVGFVKSHRSAYLPPALHAMVGRLAAGQRTPVFLMGTSWDRHAWYLRLPCRAGSPWVGVVRVECSADLSSADVVALANATQGTLCRYASVEYKDARAPQNLVPIAGLERQLRRRLGNPQVLYRALRSAAHR